MFTHARQSPPIGRVSELLVANLIFFSNRNPIKYRPIKIHQTSWRTKRRNGRAYFFDWPQYRAQTVLTLDVVVLGLLVLALALDFLGDMDVRVLKQIRVELFDETNHVVVLLGPLVHGDGHVRLLHRHVKTLSFLQTSLFR